MGNLAILLAEQPRDFANIAALPDQRRIGLITGEFVGIFARHVLDQGDFDGGGIVNAIAYIAFDWRKRAGLILDHARRIVAPPSGENFHAVRVGPHDQGGLNAFLADGG